MTCHDSVYYCVMTHQIYVDYDVKMLNNIYIHSDEKHDQLF